MNKSLREDVDKSAISGAGVEGSPVWEGDTLHWRGLFAALRPYRARLIRANLVALLAVACSVPVPLVLPVLVDEVLLHRPGPFIAFWAPWFPVSWQGPVLFVAVALALTVLLRWLALWLGIWQLRGFSLISKQVVYAVRARMLDRLGRIALSEYETLGAGKVSTYFVTDLDAIDRFMGATVSGFIVAVLSLIGVSLILLWMHWQLALLILLLNPLVIGFSVRLGKRVKQLKARENGAYEAFQEALVETLEALTQIRAMNREAYYLAVARDKASAIRAHAAAFAWKSDAMNRASFFVFLAGFDVLRAVAMLMVVFSDLSVGEMLAVFGYLWFMMSPVQEILNMQFAWQAANAALARINGFMALRSTPPDADRARPFEGASTLDIRLERASFAYGEGERVLDDVSLRIAAGEKVALVGASGGGKSTLVQVLLGLYPLTEGAIRFGGADVRDCGWGHVREHIGVVLQHPVLFNASVRDNLCMGRAFDEADLWRALDVAQLRDFVAALPQGLDSLVGKHGVRLSGGQRQRLAIARMVLAQPKVVILDEATSALDSHTERNLHVAMQAFLAGRTTLIIAHRLSAVRQADRILVFENGRIVEEGDHDSLMRQGGLYHKLYAHA